MQMQNYCTVQNGAFISYETCISPKYSALHILTSNNYQNWVVSQQSEAKCIIDLTAIKKKPEYYNAISFYSHCSFDQNVLKVKVQHKKNMQAKWMGLGDFKLQKHSGWQTFKLRNYHNEDIKFVGITLLNNFGGESFYLTQFALGYSSQSDIYRQLNEDITQLKIKNQLLKSLFQNHQKEALEKQRIFQAKIFELQKSNQKLVKMIQEHLSVPKPAVPQKLPVDIEDQPDASLDSFSKLNCSSQQEKIDQNQCQEQQLREQFEML